MRAPESRSLLCPAPALSDTPVRAVSRSEVLCPLMIHDEVCALVERYTIYSRGARSPSASLRRLSTMMLVWTRYVYRVASFQLAFLLCGFAFTVQPDTDNQFQSFFCWDRQRDGQQNFLGSGHEEKGGCFGNRQAHGGAAGRVPRGFQLIRQGVCRMRDDDVDVAVFGEGPLSARTRGNAACVRALVIIWPPRSHAAARACSGWRRIHRCQRAEGADGVSWAEPDR